MIPAVHPSETAVTLVRSELLGDLRIQPNHSLVFPTGMLGFPECRRFALLRGERDGLFWLQSMEHSALTFLLVDPFTLDSGFAFDVPRSQTMELGAMSSADVGLLAVVTLPSGDGEQPTANLQGPIVINFGARRAKQIVSSDEKFGVRYEFPLSRIAG